jgi:hypothetical protein
MACENYITRPGYKTLQHGDVMKFNIVSAESRPCNRLSIMLLRGGFNLCSSYKSLVDTDISHRLIKSKTLSTFKFMVQSHNVFLLEAHSQAIRGTHSTVGDIYNFICYDLRLAIQFIPLQF